MNNNITFTNGTNLTDILLDALEKRNKEYKEKMNHLLEWCEHETGLKLSCITEYANVFSEMHEDSRLELARQMLEIRHHSQALVEDLQIAILKEKELIKGQLHFSSIEEALAVLYALRHVELTDSELFIEAFCAFCSFAHKETKQMIRHKIAEMFPGIQPTHHDSQGNVFYSFGYVASELDIPAEEADTMVRKDGMDMFNGSKLSSISTNN